MKVGELFLALGLAVDPKEWNVAEAVIEKMTSEMKTLALSALTAKTDISKAIGTIGLPAVSAKGKLDGVKQAAAGVDHTFRKLVVSAAAFAAGFLGARKIVEMTKNVIELGGHLNDTSQKAGISTEALQEFGYAAQLNSSSMDAVNQSAIKLAKGLADIGKEQSPVRDAFTKLGISMNDPAVKSKDLTSLIYMVANKFSTMEDGAEKSAIAMDLFGKSGADLIPTLNQGVQGLRKLGDEAHQVGFVIDKATVSSLDDLGDNIDKAKMSMLGLRNQAIAALLPLLEEMVSGFQEWVKNNQDLIRSTLVSLVDALATGLQVMGKVLLLVVEHWQALAAVLAGMGIVSAIMKIIQVIAFFVSAQTAAAAAAVINWIIILGPILLIAAAVVALGVLIYKYRDQVKSALASVRDSFVAAGRKIREFFSNVWESIEGAADAVWTAIKDGFKAAFEFVGNLPIIKQLRELVDALSNLSVKGTLGASVGEHQSGLDVLAQASANSERLRQQDEAERQRARAEGRTVSLGGGKYVTPDEAVQRHNAMQSTVYDWHGEKIGADEYAKRMMEIQQGKRNGTTGQLRAVDSAGAVSREVALPVAGGASAATQSTTNITINAANANADEVGTIVEQKLRDHDERTRLQTAASLGVE